MNTLSRNDRHVLHASLRVSAGAPRHQLVFHIEEALRLCSLPGENEGRAYYFRHLHLAGLPENGDRFLWLDAFQRTLLELAGHAVHGNDGAAPTSDAVFFRNQQEACESLLALILQRRPVDAWFWPAVTGASSLGGSPGSQLASVITKLSRSEASWVAVAAAVLNSADPVSLLHLLSHSAVREWLRELGAAETLPLTRLPVLPPGRSLTAIDRAVTMLGAHDPRVLWLAALAVILESPGELESGRAVSRACLILRSLSSSRVAPNGSPLPAASQSTREGPPSQLLESPADSNAPSPTQASVEDAAVVPRNDSTASEDDNAEPLSTISPAPIHPIAEPDAPAEARLDSCFGQPTAGAGLYFLLNALKHLKLARRPFDPHFPAHFFRRVAEQCGINNDDPILLWTLVTLEGDGPHEPDERLLRVCLNRVRRWCWKSEKIAIPEIVLRPGYVTLTRTHLDVSLPLDSADIRIRRMGLDLDPGWLPWFGRVVRFHYSYRGELHD